MAASRNRSSPGRADGSGVSGASAPRRPQRDIATRLDGSLRVGELARRTGLSVRTLHHYDALGLLTPRARTPSGHRLYGEDEVVRLHEIQSLKRLGLSLTEIGDALGGGRFTALEAVRRHRDRVQAQERELASVRARLDALLEHFGEAHAVRTDALIESIEAMTTLERYYAPDQRELLEQRRHQVGDAAIHEVQEAWAQLLSEVGEARSRDLAPDHPQVRTLAVRWRRLSRDTVRGFTGGDLGLTASLKRYWTEEPGAGTGWGMGPEVRGYMAQAVAALDPDEADEPGG